MTNAAQNTLTANQVKAFYHDQFVESQVRHYLQLVPTVVQNPRIVVDMGGGCGYFAQGLRRTSGQQVRVVDMDPVSISICLENGVEAVLGDALSPNPRGDEDVVCFNLILHHLVGANDRANRELQSRALTNWRGLAKSIFVDEYIYDSYVKNISGFIIYSITSSRFLSTLAKAISRLVPSLRANTFGVGVRFRSHQEWLEMFDALGFRVAAIARGPEEHVSTARRLLLIRSCRRDSFLLVAK